jgi:hypothetical protein
VDSTNPQTWNRYAYVHNNPLSNIDPQGLDDCASWDQSCNGGGGAAGGPDLAWVGTFFGGQYSGSWTQMQLNNSLAQQFFGYLWYSLPAQQNPKAQGAAAETRYLDLTQYGWDPNWDKEQMYQWAQGVIGSNNTTVNGYTVSDNLALCTAWSESSFNPTAYNLGGGGAGSWGLFGTRTKSLTDINNIFHTDYSLQDVHNSADISTYVGTAYLSLAIYSYHGGDEAAGLYQAGDHTPGYAPKVINCVNSLNAGNGVNSFK